MTINPEDILKILLAVAAGGLIGVEREFRDKAAGFRTLIFICAGACLFTILSAKLAPASDPNRIAANIVTGVGFLGAGVILRDGGKIIGLTTAATIWLTAAIGMGLGGGEYLISGVMVVVTMVILWILPPFEQRIDNLREEHHYEIVCAARLDKFDALERVFHESGLRIHHRSNIKTGDIMTCTYKATGTPQEHDCLKRALFEDSDIREFRC